MKAAPTSIGALPQNAAAPIYQRLKDTVVAKIRSGEWGPGTRVPSENALSEDLGISRMTAHRALRELTQDGHLTRVHGVGTFVAEQPLHASLIEVQDIADEIAARGRRHSAVVHLQREEPAKGEIAAAMEIAPGCPVFHVALIHHQDDMPVQLEDRIVNPEVGRDFLHQDFTAMTPTRFLLDRVHPDELEHIVRAIMPDADACDRLAIGPDEPCLRLRRRTWSDGHVVTAATLLYPGSRYDLGARYAADRYR